MKTSRKTFQQGLTIVELMVAMVIGLILILGATGVLLTNRQAFNATEGLSSIQDSSRIAVDMLARDLRAAGGHPCLAVEMNDYTSGGNVAAEIKAQLTQAGGINLAPGNNPVNRDAAQNALQVVTITDTRTATAQTGNDITVANTPALAAGDIIIACTGRAAYLLEVAAANAESISVVNIPPAIDLTGATIASGLNTRLWYVGTNNDGRLNSLYLRIGNGAGVEMVDNVVGLTTRSIGNGAVHAQLTVCSRNDDPRSLVQAQNQACGPGRIQRTVATVVQSRTA